MMNFGFDAEKNAAIMSFFKIRGFNLPKEETPGSVTPLDRTRDVFIPTSEEVVRVGDLVDREGAILAKEMEILSTRGLRKALEDAMDNLKEFWEKREPGRFREGEATLLGKLRSKVYELRNLASAQDEELAKEKSALMSEYPVRTEEGYEQYAQRIKLVPGTPEAEHARLMTPVTVIRKLGRQDSAEVERLKQEDSLEINRDDWHDYTVSGWSRMEAERHSSREDKMDDYKKSILRAFAWTGVDPDADEYYHVGLQLAGYSPLFVKDICTQHLMRAVGEAPEEILQQMLINNKRWKEAQEAEEDRAEWRKLLDQGTMSSFEYDAYLLGFGRQKAISWPKLGGTFKSAWGAKLRFEAASALSEEDIAMTRNVACYDDSDFTKDHQSSLTSYRGARKALDDRSLIRLTASKSDPGVAVRYQARYQEFINKLVEILIEQNLGFCAALPMVEGVDLPEDPHGYNKAWYNALKSHVGMAKEKLALRAEQIFVDHSYSDLEDCYGEEVQVLADNLFAIIRREALAAAEAQEAYIGGREVKRLVEEDSIDF